MDATEFLKFILDAIVQLYPNAAEKDGKRVLLIVDSGPGRKNKKLLSFLAAREFHLLPGVPNSTHTGSWLFRTASICMWHSNCSAFATVASSSGFWCSAIFEEVCPHKWEYGWMLEFSIFIAFQRGSRDRVAKHVLFLI